MNEDIHNTFTSQTDKELTDISSNFRVFGTCPPNSVNKLSEAVLSRFTVICIPAYELSEQKLVLKSYIKLNNLHFDDSLISILVDFSEKMNTSLNRNFLFPQMINSIEMCSRLNENSDKSQWRNNLGIILYRLAYGLFENRNETKESFLKIFNDLKMKLPSNLISPNEGNPLSISQSNDGYQGIQSNISNIFFRSSNAKENNNKVAFTSMFSEMLDTLLLGISINIPVIFEGMPGQGKQTAINYISEMLGYQVINVVISQNTKVEDLFGKITITRDNKNNIKIQPIETKLVKVLKSNSDFNNNNSIIVFHNINNASSAVLEVLVSIFDQHQKDFLLPNGSTIKKGQVKMVGIFNPQNGIFNRDKLPSLLIYSSIYHIVNDPKNNEILSVIENQFINTEFGADEAKSFYNNFIETKKISEDVNASPLTLNDIVKYKKFRNVTYKKVNKDIISSMLFAYRFIDHKTFYETLKKINVNDMKFNPIFTFNSESGKLSIRVFEKDGITLDFDPKNVDINSIKSDISTLTLPERLCILFLAFSVLSKQACLIKGETASGKSHIIRLFAKMLGKKLNVYQMNSETTVSILTGQSVLSNQLSKQDIDDINSALTDLERIPEIREYIEKNIIDKTPNEWSRSLFTNLIDFISADKFSKNPEYEKIIEPSKQIIVETIQPAKRFHIEKSSFINAMINGEWVLFDGIESASSEIIEKISSLCGDNPQIDLLECGEGYYFTLDNLPGSNKINENFHLFFTYNPFSKVENKTLDQSFINNCASFTLPSIDSIPENSAQRFLGTLIQYFPKEFSVEISERLAMMHAFAKEESKNDSDSFAGELQFTGRTINFISKEFSHHVKVCQDPVETIFRPICNSIKYYYLNSYINAEKENKFKANLIDNFAKEIDKNEFQKLTYEGINLKDKYKEILIALRDIQIRESKGQNSNFNYSVFVQKCFQFIQINDIDYILDHINDTLDIIYKSDKDFTREFSQLKIIALILNDIKKGMKNLNEECYTLNLSDKDLLKTKQLNQPLSRFNLLSKLVLTEDINFFSSHNIPLYFYDSNFVSLMNSIKIMKNSNNLDTFEKFISILNTYPNFIPLIESRFPYNIFDKTPFKMIHYILPMIRLLHESNTSFQIHVSDEKYLFKYEKLSLFEPIYIIEYNSELTLSSSSKIIFKINSKINFDDKLQKDQFKDDESINNFFYNITKYFVSDKKNIGTFLESKNPLDFINKLNPRKDQIPQLSQLFSIEQLSSLVTIIWPIIYSFSKDTIIIFSDYLLPLEKDTLFTFYHIFESINKDNVEQLFDFSNWMKDFGKENSCLWQIINKRFKISPQIQYKEACDIEKQIEKEITYLKSAPRLLPKESWPIESYINKLNEQKDKINNKKDELAQKDENLRLKKKLNPIIEQLEKAPSKKNESLKLQIINEIRKDSENLSEEKIKFYQNQVNKFIESLKQEDNNYAKNTICWPTYKLTSDLSDYESPTKKLYEIIIWYSTIISIFNKINDKNNQNIFNYIVELSDFDEMQDAVNFLTNRFLHIENSSKKVLNSDENSIIKGILNANFIHRLKKTKLLDQIDQLTSILNSLEDRNAIDDENILSWIHKIANQYTPDFYISLPKFQPKDLIYLFIGYVKDGSNSMPGPLLKNSFSTPANFINNLQGLLKTNFSNSVQCSIAIAQNIIKCCTKEECTLTNDLNKLNEILNKYQSNKYVKLAIEVIDIAKKIDLMKKADFTFNDTFFFKENWIKKEEYMDRYPSLVFWLCKNYLCADKLKNIFGSQPFLNDKLPFWLFVLRLMSSENCIIFDTNSTTQTGKNLSKIIDKTIRNQIRNKIDQKKHIGTKWLNVFLPSPPPEVSIQNYQIFYQMFYQFFLNLLDDKKSLQDEIFDVKKKQLKLFVKKVFDFVFNDDLNAFFDIPLNSKNDFIISLIRDPNSFVCKEINNEMKTISNNFLKSQKMRDLSNFTLKLKDVVNTHIKTLKSIIDKEDKENEKKCNDERTKYRNKQLKIMKKNIQESIKEYNKQFKKILKHEPINNMGEFQKRCNSLIECLNDLPQYFDMTGEPIKLLKYEKKTKYKYRYYFHTIRLNKNDSIRIFDKTPYYFYPEHFDELDEKLKDDITMWTGIELFPINQQFDIDHFCERNCRITKVFEKPKLSFGKSYYHQYLMTYDQFISKITQVSVEAINFVKNLQEEINRGRINDDTFRAPSDLVNNLQNLTNNFYSQYSDDSKCDNINIFLTKMKDIFIQLKNYISAVYIELKYKVEVMWKAAYQRFEIKPVFDDVYKLPIPISKSIKYSYYHPFQTIKNTNFISNPILNVDNGSIFCCFDSLNCNLGSFVPSLYSRKITMNFISFIDEPFTMKLETNSKYMNLFPSKPCQFSKGESVQILFSLPEVKSNEPENHKISTKIIFESEKLNKLVLPCNFSVKIVPLSFLISCKQSKLAFKNNAFYVCKDTFIPPQVLTFSIKNFYLKEPTNVKYQLISLDGNTATKPIINHKYDELELQIPKVSSVKRLNAELKLKFSDSFSTSVLIDSIIIPFDFDFEVYDPIEKKFGKNAIVYYTPKYLDRKILLHFRILCPSLFEELSGEIKHSFTYDIQVIKFEDKFKIKKNREFDIAIKIRSPLKSKYNYYHYYEEQNPTYKLTVYINGIGKSISLEFSELKDQILIDSQINTKYLDKFNGYAFKETDKKWNPIHKYDETIGYSCFVSSFSYYKPLELRVFYNLGCKVNDNDCIFVYINKDGEIIEKKTTEPRIEKKNDGLFGKIKKYFISDSNSNFYPIFGISRNNWFPVFDTYPSIDNWVKIDDDKILLAKSEIEQVNKKFPSEILNPCNFMNLFRLLDQGKVIKQIKNFIQLLPIDIKKEFDYIIAYAEILDENNPAMKVQSHNAILLFKQIFEARYKEIKNSKYNTCSLTQEEIDQQIAKSYEEYSRIDTRNLSNTLNSNKFVEIETDIQNIQLKPKPESRSEAFLYTEKSSPIPKYNYCTPSYISSNNSEISYSSFNGIKFELPNLDVDDINSITIPKLNDIYLSAIKGARLLPIFVSNMKSQKSVKMENEAEKYFYNLLYLYENLPVKDMSFISLTTNLFNESFSSMIGKFKKAGVDFGRILPDKCKVTQENFQDFFQYPEKDEFNIPADKWNTSSSDPINRIDIPQNKISKLKIDSKPNKENSQKNNNINKQKSTKNKRDQDKSRVTNEEDKSLDKKNIELREFIMKKKEENNKSINQKEKKEKSNVGAIENSGENSNKKGPTRNVLVVSNEKIKEKNIKKTIFDGMLSKFTEENGIKRAISRIEDMKDKKDLSINLTKFEPTDIKKEFFDTQKVDFPITILIPFGFYFANKFIKEAFDTNIPRSKFAVNILVDCSSFICNENKIFNMMLICALTTALDSLEIPYSAAVVADKNFKCIVKSFEEQHSPKCLQKILDCLLIKRYRTKLASSIKFAIDNMSFPVDKQSEVNKRPYRAIFTFSDGLDEQLILTNAWSKEILTAKNLSFGFIFIKSSKLADTNLELLENVWANFEKEVNKGKPIDIVKIASIKAEIDDDVSDKLNILFRTVMKRSVEADIIKAKQENIYSDATFSIDENLSDIKRFSNFINSDYHSLKEIYTKSPQVLKTASTKIDKLNPIKYRNKLKKIAICKLDKSIKKEDCSEFVKQFLINKQKINQASLEAIFKPNKASQTVLSTTGTDFEITELVLNLLNPVPDPMIYLEEKGGLIRNYGISIVVDSSISCFDEISGPHSFQTLQNILSSLATLDISCFDLIIAGSPQPKVVCSEVRTIYSLSNKSLLFSSLLATLQNPTHNTDLSSAIHMAFDLRRMRSSESTSILFVLTNGLYDNKECERIVDSVNVCVQSGITTFGIGIGNYPKGIEKLFPHIIFSRNPANVMKGIATFYGDTVSLIDEMKPINFEPPLYSDFIEAAKILIENEKTPIFNSLKDSLKNIMLTLDAFDDMYNREISIGNAVDKYANPVGTNTEIYIRDLLKTQKILIVMLWDHSMNKENEEEYVHPDYITKPSKEGEECILSAVKYYGIELKIVRNYEAAIIELTKQTKKGYCDYYATWVFCGPPFEMLPEKNADPNLVGQFNEVLIKFWKNGGSIVFWAEGDPLYYQVNLFLETANFEDECASGKVSFRISGNHRGTNILYGEESDELATPKTFNRMKRYNKGLERSILSHNIRKIYEGITISYAPYNLEKIKPFKPFARDSEGGISSMFYEANIDKGTGDIVIDCGYTKCFTKMSTEGTFRYVQNIAAWTARPEVHRAIDGEEPCDWRPAAVTHNIIRGVVWPKFQILSVDPKKLQTLWAIDASESVKDNKFYHEQLKNIITEYYKEGDEFYLWSKRLKDQNGNVEYNGYERITYDQLQSFISNRRGKKGTQSSLIAKIASQSPINQHLLIVTDGAVGEDDVIASDNLMKQNNIRFNFVTTFIILDEFDPTMRENLNDPNTRSQINQQILNECRLKPDLSVGAPYSRRCQNITYSIKLDENNNITREEMASLKSDDIYALNNIDSINNYDDFVKQYDKLDHAIQASTLGQAENTDLIDKLNSLKGRVKNSGLNSQQISDFDEKFEVLFRMASGELRNKFKLEDIAAAKKGIVVS